MSTLRTCRTILLAVAVAGAAAGQGLADHKLRSRGHDDADHAFSGVRSGELIPLASLTAMIEKRFSGRILEIEFDDDHGAPVYELHVLDRNGRVFEVVADARTGKIVEIEEDD